MSHSKVELANAFVWTCDACGLDNFERAIRLEPELMETPAMSHLTDATREDIAEVTDVMEDAGIDFDGDWLVAPKAVVCKHCWSKFETDI